MPSGVLWRDRLALPHSALARRPPLGDAHQVALPTAAAERLDVRPGARPTLADRFDGPDVTVEVTGVYRPADAATPYWRLDSSPGAASSSGQQSAKGAPDGGQRTLRPRAPVPARRSATDP